MQKQRGFTVLELLIAVVFLITVGTVFFVQKRDLGLTKKDAVSKTSINAIYYNLEDVYFTANHAYPETLSADQLPGLDPDVLKDQNDVKIGDQNSAFRYEPSDCEDGKCDHYELRANLEREADFVKTSRN